MPPFKPLDSESLWILPDRPFTYEMGDNPYSVLYTVSCFIPGSAVDRCVSTFHWVVKGVSILELREQYLPHCEYLEKIAWQRVTEQHPVLLRHLRVQVVPTYFAGTKWIGCLNSTQTESLLRGDSSGIFRVVDVEGIDHSPGAMRWLSGKLRESNGLAPVWIAAMHWVGAMSLGALAVAATALIPVGVVFYFSTLVCEGTRSIVRKIRCSTSSTPKKSSSSKIIN